MLWHSRLLVQWCRLRWMALVEWYEALDVWVCGDWLPLNYLLTLSLDRPLPTHQFKARQHPDKEVFLLSTRRGLPRIALRTGTPIVPCIMFGNTDIIRAVQDSCGVMERLSRALRMSLVLLRGRFFLPVPFRKPVSVVLGKPLVPPPEDCVEGSKEPSKEAIARLHKRMVDATVALYQKHRAAFANTDKDPLVV